MAENSGEDSGSKDRATVALVYAELKNVTTLVEGHKSLTELGFASVQRQLDAVSGLPAAFVGVVQRLTSLEAWVEEEDKRRKTVSDSRRVNMPMVAIATLAAIVSIVALITQLH